MLLAITTLTTLPVHTNIISLPDEYVLKFLDFVALHRSEMHNKKELYKRLLGPKWFSTLYPIYSGLVSFLSSPVLVTMVHNLVDESEYFIRQIRKEWKTFSFITII